MLDVPPPLGLRDRDRRAMLQHRLGVHARRAAPHQPAHAAQHHGRAGKRRGFPWLRNPAQRFRSDRGGWTIGATRLFARGLHHEPTGLIDNVRSVPSPARVHSASLLGLSEGHRTTWTACTLRFLSGVPVDRAGTRRPSCRGTPSVEETDATRADSPAVRRMGYAAQARTGMPVISSSLSASWIRGRRLPRSQLQSVPWATPTRRASVSCVTSRRCRHDISSSGPLFPFARFAMPDI